MQRRKFDELISHFNRKVADMSIDQKYKMELLGMISAIGFAHEKELGTNLAEVGTDCISRQAAIDVVRATLLAWSFMPEWRDNKIIKAVERLAPIQPTDNLQKLADEIASFKRCVKSDNSDYLTGYLCALSVVEGMIADMRGEQDDSV